MIDEWQEMTTAPREEVVLICQTNCAIITAIQTSTDEKKKQWEWFQYPKVYTGNYGGHAIVKPKRWQPLPRPPKDLWERKLAADVLAKQIEVLRAED